MKARTQRRMAMSRRILKRRRPLGPVPERRPDDQVGSLPERLTDEQQRELLEHDVEQLDKRRLW